MPKRPLMDQLNEAVKSVVAHPPFVPATVDSSLEPLVRIALLLRDLPQPHLKTRLKAELQRKAAMPFVTEGHHSLMPYYLVAGAAQFIDFLKHAFGAVELFRVPKPDGTLQHAEIRVGDSVVELADSTASFPPMPTATHLYVSDADTAYNAALRAGANSIYAPVDQVYGDREAGIKDPFGNYWYIATHKAPEGPVPSGFRTLTPTLHPSGAGGLIGFLETAFDANVEERHVSPQGVVLHAQLRMGDSMLEIGEARGIIPEMAGNLHLYVPDADTFYERALQAGASAVMPPKNEPYGERLGVVRDPFGNMWCIATALK